MDLEGLIEEEMATHSNILAWEIPWAEEPGGLQSMGHKQDGACMHCTLPPSTFALNSTLS